MERTTIQRKFIYDAIKNLHHSTIQDIIDFCTNEQFPISVATIYRNLEVLENDGLIRKVPTAYKADIYEDASIKEHDHFICTECFKIIDLPKEKDFEPKEKDGNLYQREVRVYYGLCSDCLKKKQC